PIPGFAGTQSNRDLFPLLGVTLGVTTLNQLAQFGERSKIIDVSTGKPYNSYKINETNFWYDERGIANHMYMARGIHPIPDQWRALGFDWSISYKHWVTLLNRLGCSVRLEASPRIVKY